MLTLQNIFYTHPNEDVLFENIHLTVNNHDKIALIGNNGIGKSTLFRIISGEITSFGGQLQIDAIPYYIPQIFGQCNEMTVSEALRIDRKLHALEKILDGIVTEENLDVLNDDWDIEERCVEAMAQWQLGDLELTQKMGTLSGGQKTKVFLAGISIHQPELILLDEPSNHLDATGRQLLYDFIRQTTATVLVISHDRKLLNLLDTVCELNKHGIIVYGGNYDFYVQQKKAEKEALYQDVKSKEKALRKAKEKERETTERQQRLDARGKKKQEKAGTAGILMNTLRNKAENSTARLKNVHSEKIGGIAQELQVLRSELPEIDKMKFGFDHSSLHKGKIIFKAIGINFSYKTLTSQTQGLTSQTQSLTSQTQSRENKESSESQESFRKPGKPKRTGKPESRDVRKDQDIRKNQENQEDRKNREDRKNQEDQEIRKEGTGREVQEKAMLHSDWEDLYLWKENMDLQITSGGRIAIKGANGTGKTTLVKIILGELEPPTGTVYRAVNRSVYIDQDYSLIQNGRTVYEQTQPFNTSSLSEGEIKTRLNRFLFTKDDWDKSCAVLSGGERMRLMLCCLTIGQQAPDIIILDEPTNNLDIQNIEILTAAINEYQGTLIVISHDEVFLEEVGIEQIVLLSDNENKNMLILQ